MTERLATWAEATARFLVPLRISSFTETVNGTIWAVRTAGITFCRVRASAHDAVRTPELTSTGPTPQLKFAIPIRRPVTLRQDGRRVRLRPGQLALYRTNRPYEIGSEGPVDLAIVMLPVDATPLNESEIDELSATRLSGEQLPRIRSTLLRAAAGEVAETDRDRALDALVTLRTASRSHTDSKRHTRLRAQADRLIQHRLGDAAMNPEQIADALGVSRRTLYDAFARDGRSVASVIRHRRLDVARDLLTRHGDAMLSVAEVAAACGFRSPAHFSRAFHEEFGVAPSRCREIIGEA
ncbi:helix-turn-helix domain-containing protein [Pseudoclavibacter endophyticus]|uniref:helix-turn-helix domain-containing protein n=1 Tax=Pseudoclavibacter endophyticus TaxID=1778590 RepID=UPI00166C2E38|nr:helix-turn-helix domain-containing protein [Pseudoclavibacter endophyticus]